LKIVVLNGSPKGDLSVTLQYVLFIQKKFSGHQYRVFNIAQSINKIEKDPKAFSEVIEAIGASDGVLWAFPLYYLLVHANYKRFIELIRERAVQDYFEGKYAASISTSIHFFDHTAHNYIRGICDDLNMKYAGSFSPEMNDILTADGRDKLTKFAGHFFQAIESRAPATRAFPPLVYNPNIYQPGQVQTRVEAGGRKILVVSDSQDDSSNLAKMLKYFRQSFLREIEMVNLHDLKISGGCLGCMHCGYENVCVYAGKDDYIEFFKNKVLPADVLVLAGSIQDRYLSSRWKMYFDRSFFMGHAPVLMGKQIGFIISGPFSQLPNLRQIFEGFFECQQTNLVDFVSDEYSASGKIDSLLSSLAERLVKQSGENYRRPPTFLGVGGAKIFRDDIYGRLRLTFQADHKFLGRHGMYDFPQKDYQTRILSGAMIALSNLRGFRKELYRRIPKEMVKPHRKVVDRAGPQQ
jgi:multimeric flavodoxin WrbA